MTLKLFQVFYWRDNDPCGQPRQLSHVDMKPCLHHQKFDYFQVSLRNCSLYFLVILHFKKGPL